MSDKAKFSYLAGIVDGEGCLTIGAGRRQSGVVNYNSVVCVGNTDPRLIKWLHQNFGGKYYSVNKPSSQSKTPYVWRLLKHKEQELLLLAILPYLIVKRERALILLEFVRLPRTADSSGRQTLFDKLTALNKRGIGVSTNTQDDSGEELKIESGLMGDHESDPVVTQEPI